MRKLVALSFVLVAAGCGGGDDGGAVGDGRHFGYIRSVDTSSEPPTAEFDAAQFLVGPAANEAAVEDGAIAEGESVPNDYYIRNPDESTDELDVSPSVTVTRIECPDSCRDGAPGSWEPFAASFEGQGYTLNDAYRGPESQYWITVADDMLVEIEELYLP